MLRSTQPNMCRDLNGKRSVHRARTDRVIAAVAIAVTVIGGSLGEFGLPAGAAPEWSIVASPNPAGGYSLLHGVSCPNATSCFAVGSSQVDTTTTNTTKSLVERWNGSRWSIVASPNSAGTYNSLNAVSCTSATSCIAVGSGDVEGKTLVERWNGTRWSIVPAPSPTDSELDGVSCTSAAFCLAVGAYYPSGARTMFAERWDGKRWSVVPNPSNGSDSSQLLGVSCTSPTNCIAVGDYYLPTTGNNSLVERWNGTNLSIVPSPNPTGGGFLDGVSCANSTNCAAVGLSYSPDKTLVERWNGTRWSIVSSPNPGRAASFFEDVSCANATTCTAVGTQDPTNKTSKTLVERWDGTHWSVAPSPSPNDASPWLEGVSCTKANSCVTVGHYESLTGLVKTLVERST